MIDADIEGSPRNSRCSSRNIIEFSVGPETVKVAAADTRVPGQPPAVPGNDGSSKEPGTSARPKQRHPPFWNRRGLVWPLGTKDFHDNTVPHRLQQVIIEPNHSAPFQSASSVRSSSKPRDGTRPSFVAATRPKRKYLGWFLQFSDTRHEHEYRLFMKQPWSVASFTCKVFVGVIFSIAFIFPGVFTAGPFIYAAVVLYVIMLLLLVIPMFACHIYWAIVGDALWGAGVAETWHQAEASGVTATRMFRIRVEVDGQQRKQGWATVVDFVMFHAFDGDIESIIAVLTTVIASLYLIGRFHNGDGCRFPAAADADPKLPSYCNEPIWWNQFAYNIGDSTGTLPFDGVLLMYLGPLYSQLFLKCMNTKALALSLVIAISVHVRLFFVMVHQYHPDLQAGDPQPQSFWGVLIAITICFASFEIEHSRRMAFLQSKDNLAASIQAGQEEQAASLAEMDREIEEKLREKEQLRFFIGNVAHDLKTPLQSLTMDVQTIKNTLVVRNAPTDTEPRQTVFPVSVAQTANTFVLAGDACTKNAPSKLLAESDSGVVCPPRSQEERSGSLSCLMADTTGKSTTAAAADSECIEACQRLSGTISFMYMAINRAIDYTRTSSGFALQPQVDTFNMLEALEEQRDIMARISDGVSISVNYKNAAGMNPYIMSDRLWLAENVLCLLSNAVKYSPAGSEVRLTVRIVNGSDVRALTNNKKANADDLDPGVIDGSNLPGVADAPFPRNQVNRAPPRPAISASNNATATSKTPLIQEVNSESILLLEVEDAGIGVPPNLRASLFKPFKQAQRFTGGTGLGLYSLARRTEALGGLYGVRDRSDQRAGAVFWFTFPYRPDRFIEGHPHSGTASPRSPTEFVTVSARADEVNTGGEPVVRPSRSPTSTISPQAATMERNADVFTQARAVDQPFLMREMKSDEETRNSQSYNGSRSILRGSLLTTDLDNNLYVSQNNIPPLRDSRDMTTAPATNHSSPLHGFAPGWWASDLTDSIIVHERSRIGELPIVGDDDEKDDNRVIGRISHPPPRTSDGEKTDRGVSFAFAASSAGTTRTEVTNRAHNRQEKEGWNSCELIRGGKMSTSDLATIPFHAPINALADIEASGGDHSSVRSSSSYSLPNRSRCETRDASAPPTAHASGSNRLRILVVDDALSILKVVSRYLVSEGHHVETAKNGFVALERMKKAIAEDVDESTSLDLVLMDIQMPVMDGVEAVRRFREEEQRVLNITSASARRKRISQLRNPFIYGPSTSRHRLLVVGMSANCGVDSKTLAKEAGMDFFLGKPFTPSIFMRLMNRVAFGYRSPETSTGSLPPVKV